MKKLILSAAAAASFMLAVSSPAPAYADLADSPRIMQDGNSNIGKVVTSKSGQLIRKELLGALLPYRMAVRRVAHNSPNPDGTNTWRVNAIPLAGAPKNQALEYRMRDLRDGSVLSTTSWRSLRPRFSDRKYHRVRPGVGESRVVQVRIREYDIFGESKIISRTWSSGRLGSR